MTIRTATAADLRAVTELEAACFPAAEAATEADFAQRLAAYPHHFWLLEENGRLISFIDGLVTDEPILRDEMYENAALHNEQGAWQMIFGVNTLPAYRRQGCAGRLMEQVIADARAQGRKGCVLTCKAALVHYYEKFGYVSEGRSDSTHGGAEWYDMRLTF
jgi:predicted N-acetyltransferase YhbS